MTAPYYTDATVTIHHGDCLDVLRGLPDASVDAVVTDPPYGLGFMGHQWDQPGVVVPAKREGIPSGQRRRMNPAPSGFDLEGAGAKEAGRYDLSRSANQGFQDWCQLWATECLRVLKPGGHMLAFGGTRTSHRLACAVEDAGFEIRDSIAWLYGSGFPKSLDVSKAIDKAAGAERTEVIGKGWHASTRAAEGVTMGRFAEEYQPGDAAVGRDQFAPATDAARTWQGWGTALKPAHEPIVVARKPLAGTVAANVLAHGTGALNVDGCRVAHDGDIASAKSHGSGAGRATANINGPAFGDGLGGVVAEPHAAGRWPANVVLDEHSARALDTQSGELSHNPPATWRSENDGRPGAFIGNIDGRSPGDVRSGFSDSGGASRFFYTAKAGSSERIRVDLPCEVHGVKRCTICGPLTTAHPTVKPLALMRWLVRLVTPPGGTVLEPFAGSGTTVEACILEGFRCIAIEREADYLPLIRQRIHRRRDPVEAVRGSGEDAGLFDLLGEEPA